MLRVLVTGCWLLAMAGMLEAEVRNQDSQRFSFFRLFCDPNMNESHQGPGSRPQQPRLLSLSCEECVQEMESLGSLIKQGAPAIEVTICRYQWQCIPASP